MRKILIFLLITVMLLVPTTTVAFAEELDPVDVNYYVIGEDVKFCSKTTNEYNEIEMRYDFTLPNTYYLIMLDEKVTDKEGKEYCLISYNDIKGYVLTSDITNGKLIQVESSAIKEQLNNETAYLTSTVTLKKSYTTNSGLEIPEGTKLIRIGTRTLASQEYYFIKYQDGESPFVFIPNTDEYFTEHSIPKHSFPSDNNSSVVVDENKLNPYNKLATNILTICIAVICVAMVLLIYWPRKKPIERNESDDDYYSSYKSSYNARNDRDRRERRHDDRPYDDRYDDRRDDRPHDRRDDRYNDRRDDHYDDRYDDRRR